MMTAWHLPTAYLMAGILYLVMPIAVWAVLRKQHLLSSSLWSLGGMAFGLCMIFYGLRDIAPEPLTFVVASSLLILGPLMRIEAIRHELGQPIRWIWPFGLCAFFGLIYQLLHSVWMDANLRFIWTSLCSGLAFLALAWHVRTFNRHEPSTSARWIFGVYLALGCAMLLRTPNLLLGYSQPQAMTQDALSHALIVLGMVSSIVGNFGFLGIFIERMNRLALIKAAEQARQEESARLSNQIAQLDRRRGMGEIAASLAHELSQPLTTIFLASDGLRLKLNARKDHTLDDYLDNLHRNAQNASDILERIRSFIRSREVVMARVEMAEVISNARALLHDLAHNESVIIHVALDSPGLAVRADAVQLTQVFMNVMRNAIQATQGQARRELHIRAWRDGPMARIRFTDNGPGFSTDAKHLAGSAFFSTTPEGLGVGLSISKSIAQRHGGSLNTDNSPLGGAVVEMQLPASD